MSSRKRANVNCERSSKRVWLVKVPRYLSRIWEANAGAEVGKLHVGEKSNPNLIEPEDDSMPGPSNALKRSKLDDPIPKEHRFDMKSTDNQSLAVLMEDKTGLEERAEIQSGRLSVEGVVVQRAECRPPANLSYMKLKMQQIEKARRPARTIIQLDRAAPKFLPISQHAFDTQRQKAKKDGIKTVRVEKDVLRQALFHAFEKHQYYRLQDLQQITNQPAGFVKEVLQEIAIYNGMPPHKNMWELKPEYRNYTTQAD